MKRLGGHNSSNLLFRRYQGNPILTPAQWPYSANAVFNPGATKHDGKVLLLVRVEDMRGFSHLTLARSKDGKSDWRISSTPALKPNLRYKEELWGLEDPRIVWLEERQEYAITYVSFSTGGPLISLALTKDFQTFTRFGALLPPEDKDASLFPRLINGQFVLIHRPIIRGEAHIWICSSPDLTHWGKHRMLIPVRPGWWDSHRVGLGPPPLETPWSSPGRLSAAVMTGSLLQVKITSVWGMSLVSFFHQVPSLTRRQTNFISIMVLLIRLSD